MAAVCLRQRLDKPHGPHPVRLAPQDPRLVDYRDLDATAPEIHQHPLPSREVDTTANGQVHEPRLLATADRLQHDVRFL